MENEKKKIKGLSQDNRKLIVAVFTIVLLFWGPVVPYGMVVRIAYLILLPTLLWFILGYLGSKLDTNKITNDRLTRAIVSMIAAALFIGAYFAFTADYHTECDHEVRTGDGTECIGDYVTVKGNDKVAGVIQLILGGVATWYAVSKHEKNQE